MTPLSELTDKDLAIKLAKIFGDRYNEVGQFSDDTYENIWDDYEDYIYAKASQILFSEGMAGKIGYAVFKDYKEMGFVLESCCIEERNWWRTITPRKIIEVYLQLND